MTLGELYAAVKPSLYPRGVPERGTQNRDVSILKRLRKGYGAEEVVALVQSMRAKTERGDVTGWVEPGQNFTMKAVLNAAPLLLAESRKIVEKKPAEKKAIPVSLSTLLGNYLA